MTRTSSIPVSVALAVLFAGFCAFGQDDPAPKPAPPAPGTESSPEALAVLDAAIAHQGPEEFAKEGSIRDLTVHIQADVWDYSKESADKVSMGVSRYLTMNPERFRSEWRTAAGTQVYGFDGTRYWYADYDSSGKLADERVNPRFLLGDKYTEERVKIQDEVGETKYLLRFFFLANLRGDHVVFALKPDQTIDSFGTPRACRVLGRSNLDPKSTEPPLTLWIDAKDGTLLRAEAHATDYGQKSLIFSFRYDEQVQGRVKGVLFPFKIETEEQPFGAQRARLANRAIVEENGIHFNTGLPADIFKCPRRPK